VSLDDADEQQKCRTRPGKSHWRACNQLRLRVPLFEPHRNQPFCIKLLGYERRLGESHLKRRLSKSDQFAPELVYFSDCILQDRDPEPSGMEGLTDIRVIEGMLKSIKTGRWTTLAKAPRLRRPSRRQEIRRPAVPREPPLIKVKSASQ
jgi:hypothetical protein